MNIQYKSRTRAAARTHSAGCNSDFHHCIDPAAPSDRASVHINSAGPSTTPPSVTLIRNAVHAKPCPTLSLLFSPCWRDAFPQGSSVLPSVWERQFLLTCPTKAASRSENQIHELPKLQTFASRQLSLFSQDETGCSKKPGNVQRQYRRPARTRREITRAKRYGNIGTCHDIK
jgi:hypothetical protein